MTDLVIRTLRGLARWIIAPALALASHSLVGAEGPNSQHPMDALSGEELSATTEILHAAKLIDHSSRLPLVVLREPRKVDVLNWAEGDRMGRSAFVIVKNGAHTFEAEVDVDKKEVLSWTEIQGVTPAILLSEEWDMANNIVKADAQWRSAISKRGIDDWREVTCTPLTVGYFGVEERATRRLVKVVCYHAKNTENFWGRPIAGLIALLDLHSRKVVELIDSGVVPIPSGPVDIDEESVGGYRTPATTISHSQPDGPSFTINGQQIAWQNWRFHFRIDPRLGLIVSLVHYEDGGKLRSVLYQGSLSELFVPYMDPDVGWYFRTYLDAGEFGVGKLSAPLTQSDDCPSTAVYFDAVFADDWGAPYVQPRAACLFERSMGHIAWRHYEASQQKSHVRKRTELVLRSVSTVGNYDYIFDWVFRQNGSIKINVGTSGTEQVKAVRGRTINGQDNDWDPRFGRMIAPNIVAPNHDHFFSFRLDLDVDGPSNSFLVDRLVTHQTNASHPRSGYWRMETGVARTESQARLNIQLDRPALWRVINPDVRGPVGYPVSYQVKPETNATSLLRPTDDAQQRGGFTQFHLWVTPFDRKEKYAAGTYPNQSNQADGLPTWTGADRPIKNTDVVVWYTLGFHHVVRAEDWPVLPTGWHGFEIRPFDFFARNPAIDIPPSQH